MVSRILAEQLMKRALELASIASEKGEVPVGAVIAFQDSIISEAHNEVEARHFSGAHAEMLAIERASKKITNWRLSECVLCVTLEPCTMCLGAIRLSRIPTVIYGAPDPRAGAMGGIFDLSQDPRLGPVPRVISGVCGPACVEQLQAFFKLRR